MTERKPKSDGDQWWPDENSTIEGLARPKIVFDSGYDIVVIKRDCVTYTPWLGKSECATRQEEKQLFDWLEVAVRRAGGREFLKDWLGTSLALLFEYRWPSPPKERASLDPVPMLVEALNRLIAENDARSIVPSTSDEVEDPTHTFSVRLNVRELPPSLRDLTSDAKRLEDERVERIAKEIRQGLPQFEPLTLPDVMAGLEPIQDAISILRKAVRPILQEHLDRVVAASQEDPDLFPTVAAKRDFALQIQTLLDRIGMRISCPTCSEPGVLVGRGERQPGKFSIQHSNNTRHKGGKSLPPLKLVDLPTPRRRSDS